MANNTGNPIGSTAAKDLSDNAENLDKFANGDDYEYDDRLGRSRKSLKWIEDAALAIPAIDAALRSEQQAVRSEAEAGNALAASIAAGTARDAAQAAAGIYVSTVIGLGKTVDGQCFGVPSPNSPEYAILYENRAGLAVDTGKRFLSAEFVVAISSVIYDQTGRAPQLRNLFDLNRTSDGFYIDTAGGVTANTLYYVSDYIPVSESQQYVFASTVSSIAFYSFNKSFLSQRPGAGGGASFSTPPSTHFIRFSHTLSTNKAKQMLLKGSSVPTTFMGFGFTDPATQDKKTHNATLALIGDSASGAINLFDQLRATDGFALAADGSLYAAPAYFVSRMSPIKSATNYRFSHGSSMVVFYDSNKLRISNTTASGSAVLTSPADACYIRYNLTALLLKSVFMLIEGDSLPLSYVAYGTPTNSSVSKAALEVARSVSDASQPVMRNVFDLNRAVLNTAISAVNGAISAAENYFVTGKLPVTPGGFFVSTYGPSQLCFYDVSGAFVSGSTEYSSFGNKPVPVPAGVYFIQFQVSPLTRLPALMISPGATVPAGYIPFGGMASKLPWQDKKLVILGDSISATGLYIPALLAGTGMSLLANHAKAGRPVREMGMTAAGVVLTEADLANADLVCSLLATNDYGGNRALGTLADAYNGSVAATFYNDLFKLLTLIYTLKPTIRVVFCTPLKRGAFEDQPVYPAANAAGAKLDQYVAAINEVCSLFSVPVCDLFRDGGFNLLNLGAYTGDNLHPNAAGSALHVRPMIAAINAC